ncbi:MULTISPECIES: MgtC/SapB family protein [Rugamonas]|jgi:uncharacterized membrane protein (DUF4010 family)|uniref:Uncharacterized membrane protein, DUF4010 family n=1 Tax=Rugamonas rubra TaxID=758825 RepID=A0A1I4PEN7_9BURK|nr:MULTISPECIES: DUF4010 domain-containing protein [Rugamonas]WGG53209.1 DUF4010 domain-containing protein [Rugamonas sp. DEMB1]SFM26231.1 Uncharacterized membrane protein, DUF4010 family [Rugamonas rubra]
MNAALAGLPYLPLLTGLSVALGCGLLIGIERERRKGSGPQRGFAGVRSVALVCLCGALAQILAAGLVVVGAAMVAALCAISYWRRRPDDPGVTTELAFFLAYLLGVCAVLHPGIAAGAAVVIAGMLNLRQPLHHFARVTLRAGELRDGLILAGAALIVWPLLPDAASDWLLGANPRRLWGVAVVIMGLQGAAHIALRVTSPGLGLAVAGLASGFVSSTATTAAMGQRYRADPTLLGPCVTAALLSNVATYILLLVIALAVAPNMLGHVAPSLGAALLATLVLSAIRLRATNATARHGTPPGRAFSVWQALLFALILSGATGLVAFAHNHFGSAAATAGAILAGLVDAHAAAGSVLSLAASGTLTPPELVLSLLLVISSNTCSKLLAAASGGRAFFVPMAFGLLAILLAAWVPYWLAWR